MRTGVPFGGTDVAFLVRNHSALIGPGAPNRIRRLIGRVDRTLDRAVGHGFEKLLDEQEAYLSDFWRRSDIKIEAGHERAQQFVRFNLFHLLQGSARAEGTGVPAKGLTGQAYEGHYFWDSEIYVMPFLVYTAPHLARNMLRYRYNILDHFPHPKFNNSDNIN